MWMDGFWERGFGSGSKGFRPAAFAEGSGVFQIEHLARVTHLGLVWQGFKSDMGSGDFQMEFPQWRHIWDWWKGFKSGTNEGSGVFQIEFHRWQHIWDWWQGFKSGTKRKIWDVPDEFTDGEHSGLDLAMFQIEFPWMVTHSGVMARDSDLAAPMKDLATFQVEYPQTVMDSGLVVRDLATFQIEHQQMVPHLGPVARDSNLAAPTKVLAMFQMK
ncbi:hypothetical protein BS47DRAFT_1368828 [Hydnum rufescens UP504]|uniref:Uncharacterized protein n=1 Tax=Hydnum rufescens UP504 TaxID=1448309 RepID=A0A9P6DML2_9AGAM|nr:hypothetical protein BS47DRAFT_1368828 [Hydnum rufescens UP504]